MLASRRTAVRSVPERGPLRRQVPQRFKRVIEYRTFHNDDPPGLIEIWNEALVGRGAAQLRNSTAFERHALAKPYFDPAGLIVAVDGNTRVGFAHAGFGPNQRE